MNRRFLVTGAVFGLLSVILGAFAAHGLQDIVSAESVKSFETGVRFQMYHALLLLILGSLRQEGKWNSVYYLLTAGTILFSGSIYLLATNDLSSFDFRSTALVTPLGGTILIFGWLLLCWKFIKLKIK